MGLLWPEVGCLLTLIGSHLRSMIPGVHSGAFPHSQPPPDSYVHPAHAPNGMFARQLSHRLVI